MKSYWIAVIGVVLVIAALCTGCTTTQALNQSPTPTPAVPNDVIVGTWIKVVNETGYLDKVTFGADHSVSGHYVNEGSPPAIGDYYGTWEKTTENHYLLDLTYIFKKGGESSTFGDTQMWVYDPHTQTVYYQDRDRHERVTQ